MGGLIVAVGKAVAPLFLIPAIGVLISLLGQRAFVFAPEKLSPKLNRISPIAGAKNKLGVRGLFEFAKSATKLILVSLLLLWFVVDRVDLIISASAMSTGQLSVLMASLLIEFMLVVFVMALIIGGVDYLWQFAEHLKKNRMTRKEVQDESKESEGDPQFKQQRRQRAYDIAMNQMLADVPGADVIVVNPTHFAVALKWDRASGKAPVCVAKGVDEIASRIREIGADAQVPIYSDPPTARAIFASVDIGHQIQPDHYRAIAAAIKFAESIREKARART